MTIVIVPCPFSVEEEKSYTEKSTPLLQEQMVSSPLNERFAIMQKLS